MNEIEIKDRLICALDVDNYDEALRMVEMLDGVVSFFKVGIILQLATGHKMIDYLVSNNKKVFLDMKYFDVPETVERAVTSVARSGVSFLTIHGNSTIIERAVRGRGDSELQLLAVTILTSLDQIDIQDLGFECSLEQLVLHRARKALEFGCDGVISSPNEIEAIRKEVKDQMLIVTPGIRPGVAVRDDHKRYATANDAINRGADYIVVGRPITEAPDPRQAAMSIIEEMALGASGQD